ncbi:MAG: hypothetical protein KC620_21985, partial [Myxococcales bacterium]|nr:hypothetical protein [Myxococcales bacterium]
MNCWFALLLALPAAVNAKAVGVNPLTGVDFTTSADRMELTVRAEQPIAPDQISAQAEGNVLMLRVDGVQTTRRWLATPDDLVKRTLLHPSRQHAPAAVIRMRLNAPVSAAVVENIRVRAADDGALIAAIPRDARVAARWAAVDAPVAAQPAPNAVKLNIGVDKAPAAAIEVPAALAAASTSVGGIPEALAAPASISGEDAPLEAPAPEAVDQPLIAGLGEAGPEGPSLAAVLASLLFLSVVGFIMWRKMRTARPTGGNGPLI